MPKTELSVLVISNLEFADISKGLVGVVLSSDEENLEAFLPEWSKLLNDSVHIFCVVKATYDCIEFEFDPELLAPLCHLKEFLGLVSASSSDLNVYLLIEGVARDG